MEKFELMQLSKPVMSHLAFKLYIKKKACVEMLQFKKFK